MLCLGLLSPMGAGCIPSARASASATPSAGAVCTERPVPPALAMPAAQHVQGSYCAGAPCVGVLVAARRDDGVLVEVLADRRVRLVQDDGRTDEFALRLQEPPFYDLRPHPQLPAIDGDRLILFADASTPDEHGDALRLVTGERFTMRAVLLECSLARLRGN